MSISITKIVDVDVDIDVQEHLCEMSRREMLELAQGLATHGVTFGSAGSDEAQCWQSLRATVKAGDLTKVISLMEHIAWNYHDVVLDTTNLQMRTRG